MICGKSGFLYLDKNDMPMVALHWEKYFQHICEKYNSIYKVQMPKITPHVCRHTFCSNMAKSGMNPKTLQYIMGHSDIGVTLNTYTHIGFEDAQEELQRVCDTAKYENGRKFPVQSVLLLQGKDLRQSSAIEFRHISQKRASSKT